VAPSTSPQRTYRYLRLAVAGTVVVIFVSMAIAAMSVGWLTTVSDYFYTPARNAFVGALIAVAVGLLALSGRGLERALLDAAALFAPLIALIPTTLAPGSVPGVDVPCAGRCFPPAYEADAANGVLTYLVVGILTVLIALFLAALRQVSLATAGWSLIVAVVVLAAVGAMWLFAPDLLLAQGHFVATIAFFALFALVALRNAFPRRTAPPRRPFRAVYVGIAVGLAAVLIAYVVLLPRADELDAPIVLIAEAVALVLFAAFWVTQCIEKWNDLDPSLV